MNEKSVNCNILFIMSGPWKILCMIYIVYVSDWQENSCSFLSNVLQTIITFLTTNYIQYKKSKIKKNNNSGVQINLKTQKLYFSAALLKWIKKKYRLYLS